MTPPIDHVVVLMLENRSFDHILGWLRPGAPGDPFQGLTGSETNPVDPADASKGTVSVSRSSGEDGYVTVPDPHHEFDDVTWHVFGEGDATDAPTNTGFYSRYAALRAGEAPLSAAAAARVMSCFDTAAQLPVIATLAEHFLVCDHWFASVPGPTWPNRFFAHCATSGGHVESPTDAGAIWAEAGHSIYGMPTIYENLAAAGESWGIYYHDVPQALALGRLHDHRANFHHFSAFLDAAAAGTLPSYSFIEPAYFNVPLLGLVASDMHPPHDVRHGEALIAEVYNALRANPAVWERCLFLVVWDEHGAFFDHVPPPAALPPDLATKKFAFDRLGVRVPAIVVSPYVRKGAVDSVVRDHASIPATLRVIHDLTAPLTLRDAKAATLEGLLTEPLRADTPPRINALPTPPLGAEVEDKLSTMQRQLLAVANDLDVTGRSAPGELEGLVLHVARYLDV